MALLALGLNDLELDPCAALWFPKMFIAWFAEAFRAERAFSKIKL